MDHNAGGDAKGMHGRPLGRGLEDVSHLFLSQKPSDATTGRSTPVLLPEPESSASHGPHGNVVVLRPMQVTRDRLFAILPLDWSETLEEGLRTIDAKMPCYPCGEIDLLAVDRLNKLTIIDFDTTLNDGLLLRSLAHFDWIAHNMLSVRRMCPAQGIDFSLPPRLILLAPQFSPLLRGMMRQLTRPQIHLVRYHAVETPAGPGILFEPVTGE